ncbi:MAG: alpha-amylase family glycosyl hydrolase [Spirochaetota bacterium]
MNSPAPALCCALGKLDSRHGGSPKPSLGDRWMEFHVHARIRTMVGLESALFRTSGNLILPDFPSARRMAELLRSKRRIFGADTTKLGAGRLNALGLIDEVLHMAFRTFREKAEPLLLERLEEGLEEGLGKEETSRLLREFCLRYPSSEVYRGLEDPEDWLARSQELGPGGKVSNRLVALEELILLKLANENPAFAEYRFLFDDGTGPAQVLPDPLGAAAKYEEAFGIMEGLEKSLPRLEFQGESLGIFELLRLPAAKAPHSLEAQLAWIKEHWGAAFQGLDARILSGFDLIAEEETPRFPPGRAPAAAYSYSSLRQEYEKFSSDKAWMPSAVMIAKNVLVWMHQLSESYGRPIQRIDQIPDQELDALARRGINGLWLIGLWQRSGASEKIKRLCGNPEAAASAYSLFDYEIDPALGGWDALDALRDRCAWRGIRLAADMVPNHTGIDSAWVRRRPELFLQTDRCPYPGYSFDGPDLSEDPEVGIWLEDHYYRKSDAAVVFKRMDRRTGQVRYIYHGNDGTGMAWNDTAQIDFLNPEARKAVRERILHVARHFGIIRFDAAMVLARQHIRRLWYPVPGQGGAIPSRAEHSLSDEAFDRAMPAEFWREVVDECAAAAPDTLLLAEAFWMMEGYFVRTLGMHRVYNSAFMNMLKDEKNSLYRLTIKNTQEFDRQILKRFVNFMSNPDEETAVDQFGSGDKYFGVCTLMATLPGLPMFGHGQIEGFTEKYGMEYRRSYRDEKPDQALVDRHEREIFPLLRMRPLFAEVDHFYLFDFIRESRQVDENVFAYSNGAGQARALVFYNNHWERTRGRISLSSPYAEKDAGGVMRSRTKSLAEALDLDPGPDSYLLARELKSGLWHAYRCGDIVDKGWEASLEGYQSLVFSDFVKAKDFDGRYERLLEILGGRGAADIDAAMEEAKNPELYHALALALESAGAAAEEPGEAKNKDFLEKSEFFYAALAKALYEDQASYPPISSVDLCSQRLSKGLDALDARSGADGAFSKTQGRKLLLAYLFVNSMAPLAHRGNKKEELTYIFDAFSIRRRLEAFLGGTGSIQGLEGLDAASSVSILFAFATRPSQGEVPPPPGVVPPPAMAAAPKARALELLSWARQDREARNAFGINEWEGTAYYVKERLEAILELWPILAALEKAPAGLDGDEESRTLALKTAILAAHRESGYRLDRLGEILESNP